MDLNVLCTMYFMNYINLFTTVPALALFSLTLMRAHVSPSPNALFFPLPILTSLYSHAAALTGDSDFGMATSKFSPGSGLNSFSDASQVRARCLLHGPEKVYYVGFSLVGPAGYFLLRYVWDALFIL
jgi:hypothetical protein